MIQALNVTRIIEELIYENSPVKNATGSFLSVEQLAQDAGLLTRKHAGLFAYLAFHPQQDNAVREYVEGQSVCSDAGTSIMVLTMAAQPCGFAEDVTPELLVGKTAVTYARHPAYEIAEWMFPTGRRPLLPGLLIFDQVFDVRDALYVPLAGCEDRKQLGDLCRKAFLFAEEAWTKDKVGWIDRAAARLNKEKIDYQRTGDKSLREWMVNALRVASKAGMSLVALFPKVVSKFFGL